MKDTLSVVDPAKYTSEPGVCVKEKGGNSPEAFLRVCLCFVPHDWVL